MMSCQQWSHRLWTNKWHNFSVALQKLTNHGSRTNQSSLVSHSVCEFNTRLERGSRNANAEMPIAASNIRNAIKVFDKNHFFNYERVTQWPVLIECRSVVLAADTTRSTSFHFRKNDFNATAQVTKKKSKCTNSTQLNGQVDRSHYPLSSIHTMS